MTPVSIYCLCLQLLVPLYSFPQSWITKNEHVTAWLLSASSTVNSVLIGIERTTTNMLNIIISLSFENPLTCSQRHFFQKEDLGNYLQTLHNPGACKTVVYPSIVWLNLMCFRYKINFMRIVQSFEFHQRTEHNVTTKPDLIVE